jgi:drug/metabolite transporter (DMT)-like permease
MALALLAAAGIAICYGLATVLQSIGVKSTASGEGLDPGLFVRLASNVPYLLGLAMDGLGFGLTIVALQTLPLFVVEAFTAGALAVTAVAAAAWLKIPLSRAEWIGVGSVTLGLAALGLSAGADQDVTPSTLERWLPLLATLGLLVVTWLVARIPGRSGVFALGAVAGFGFGLVGIATRILVDPLSVSAVVRDPAAYGVVAAGALAILALATALQRGQVTQATAAMVVAETVIPSAIGLLFLGDTIRPGFAAVAGVGMLVAIVGSVALARLGEIPEAATVPDGAVLSDADPA